MKVCVYSTTNSVIKLIQDHRHRTHFVLVIQPVKILMLKNSRRGVMKKDIPK